MSRLLPFETLHNTRDLGGMLTVDGRRIKSGKLIRSGRLNNLSQNDRDRLSELVDTVIDFRDDQEIKEYPDSEIPGVKYYYLPVLAVKAAGITRELDSEKEMLSIAAEDPMKALEMITGLYTSFVMTDYPVSQYRKFLDILLEDHEKGVLWHCSGGKDRAGIASVIVEEILGVPHADVIADYLKTNDYIADDTAIMMQHAKQALPADAIASDEALMYLLSAKQEYFDAFYGAVLQKHGDFSGYLHYGLGLTEGDIAKLKEMYLEDA